MSTVCAIVPTFNRADLIPECLDSILAQTRPVDEIIVVIDGSTDGTQGVIDHYGTLLRVIVQKNAGKQVALNEALAVCASDYVWICDDDDIAEPYACEALAAALDGNPDAGFSYGPYRRFRDVNGVREILPMSYWPENHETELYLALLERCFFCQFSSMVRRSVYESVGPFDKRLVRSEDYDMALRIARCHTSAFVDRPMFLQRQHDGHRGTVADRFSAKKSAAKFIAYDRIIFEGIKRDVPLTELEPAFAKGLPDPLRSRAALLQRACIFGRHAMWEESIDDLERASVISPTTPVSSHEKHIASRILFEDEMVPYLLGNDDLVTRLKTLLGASEFGRAITTSFVAPLFWQIKQAARKRDARKVASRSKFLAALIGPSGVLKRGGSMLWRPFTALR